MPFTRELLDIEGLLLIKPRSFVDERGFFMETYKESDFNLMGITSPFVQDNFSYSKRNVLRGLHFQREPKAQGKLVRVSSGTVWDVAVDIRRSSATFLQWRAVELSAENGMMLWIPPGFAHGFLTLSDNVHLQYKCTAEFDPALDSGIRWDDPALAIDWPTASPVVSAKDAVLPYLGADR